MIVGHRGQTGRKCQSVCMGHVLRVGKAQYVGNFLALVALDQVDLHRTVVNAAMAHLHGILQQGTFREDYAHGNTLALVEHAFHGNNVGGEKSCTSPKGKGLKTALIYVQNALCTDPGLRARNFYRRGSACRVASRGNACGAEWCRRQSRAGCAAPVLP